MAGAHVLDVLAAPVPSRPNGDEATAGAVERLFDAFWGHRPIEVSLTAPLVEDALLVAAALGEQTLREVHEFLVAQAVCVTVQAGALPGIVWRLVPSLRSDAVGWSVAGLDYLRATESLPALLTLRHVDVRAGRVPLNETQFAALLVHYLRRHADLRPPAAIAHRLVPYEGLLAASRRRRATLSRRLTIIRRGDLHTQAFPPCIQRFLHALRSGEPVPHAARFNLAAFLHAAGAKHDAIVDAFRGSAHFDERTTAYQVAHITGQNYRCMACPRMRDLGLCPDSTCPGPTPVLRYGSLVQRGA